MAQPGHFEQGYYKLLRLIKRAGGVPCESAPTLFFPEDIVDPELKLTATRSAKALCSTCPIKHDCYEFAVTTNQQSGIWGGTSPSER
jgi:WhiB family redox-sensing transcriptional regulator